MTAAGLHGAFTQKTPRRGLGDATFEAAPSEDDKGRVQREWKGGEQFQKDDQKKLLAEIFRRGTTFCKGLPVASHLAGWKAALKGGSQTLQEQTRRKASESRDRRGKEAETSTVDARAATVAQKTS